MKHKFYLRCEIKVSQGNNVLSELSETISNSWEQRLLDLQYLILNKKMRKQIETHYFLYFHLIYN